MILGAHTTKPKKHHFVPVGHLARFSSSPPTVEPRARLLEVYDKRTATYSRPKCAVVAAENDLYTIRIPQLKDVPAAMESLLAAVFDPQNKDPAIEDAKTEIETAGLHAIAATEQWQVGSRELTEEIRAPLVAYVGLLIAQHPTMMQDRSFAVRDRLLRAASKLGDPPDWLHRMIGELTRGAAVLAMALDSVETAFELNYLALKLARRTGPPYFVLGDNAVVAAFGTGRAQGDVWTPGASFHVPLGPTSLLTFGGFEPGRCDVVEHGSGEWDEMVHSMNILSWVRARGQIFGRDRADLDQTVERLGQVRPTVSLSRQFVVRDSVLPDFELAGPDDLRILQPSVTPDGTKTAARFQARFGRPET